MEADAKVVRERRMRRATRRPDEPLEDLLQKSRDQALALDFSATADPDEAQGRAGLVAASSGSMSDPAGPRGL